MGTVFYGRGLVNAQVVNGILQTGSSNTFKITEGNYYLIDHHFGKRQYLLVLPEEDWKEMYQERLGISERLALKLAFSSTNIETIVDRDGRTTIMIPNSRQVFGSDTVPLVINPMLYCFELWKPKDFEKARAPVTDDDLEELNL